MKEKIGVWLCGIRYARGSGHLRGCHNDIRNIFYYLQRLYSYSNYELDVIILADFKGKICDIDCIWPSKLNILNSLEKLREKGFKKYFIHYSGHGTSQTDFNGDEEDVLDEVICPYDYSRNGYISDDKLNSHFLQYLDKDCQVRILMDCCRSGTIWDLKYRYTNGVIEKMTAPELSCNVVALSGCKDNQYSLDVYTNGETQGAFTYCFLKSINNQSITELVKLINTNLKNGGWGEQTSRLTSSFILTDRDIFFSFDKIEEVQLQNEEQAIQTPILVETETPNLFQTPNEIQQEEAYEGFWLLNICSVM